MGLHPELMADAERVLDQAGVPWEKVIAVEPDAILYENRCHRARTLWLLRQGGTGRLRVLMAEGFPAFPPPAWADSTYAHPAGA